MIHENVTTRWVYEHYLTYLHLCIADGDCVISNNELEDIRCNSFKSLDSDRCSSLIKEVYQEFLSHTDTEKRDYIKKNASNYLRTESIRNRVISTLEGFVEGKHENSEEVIMFRFIRIVINNLK